MHRFRTYLKTAHERLKAAADEWPVLSEIERIKRQEQIAAWDKNEKAMLEKLATVTRASILRSIRKLSTPFLEWCSKQGVRHCLAQTLGGRDIHCRACPSRRGICARTLLTRSRALHDYHGQPNSPAATQQVRAALEKIIKRRGATVLDQGGEGDVFLAPVRHPRGDQSSRATS